MLEVTGHKSFKVKLYDCQNSLLQTKKGPSARSYGPANTASPLVGRIVSDNNEELAGKDETCGIRRGSCSWGIRWRKGNRGDDEREKSQRF